MKIEVTNVQELEKNIVVNFCCKVGDGIAVWVSSVKPIIGAQYDVEIDVNKMIDQVQVSGEGKGQNPFIAVEGFSVIFNGIVESLDNDGMAYFRLSQDCLIMIEAGEANIKAGELIKMMFNYSDVELTAQRK